MHFLWSPTNKSIPHEWYPTNKSIPHEYRDTIFRNWPQRVNQICMYMYIFLTERENTRVNYFKTRTIVWHKRVLHSRCVYMFHPQDCIILIITESCSSFLRLQDEIPLPLPLGHPTCISVAAAGICLLKCFCLCFCWTFNANPDPRIPLKFNQIRLVLRARTCKTSWLIFESNMYVVFESLFNLENEDL